MKKSLLSNMLVIGVIILFAGASVVSSTVDKKTKLFEIDREISTIRCQGDLIVLFEDDFDDNLKDMTKWTEIYSNGIWDEINQRAEFQCNEHIPTYYEGIESKPIYADISTDTPLEITCKMISYISRYGGYVGKLFLRITDDSDNYIYLMYRSSPNSLEVGDSQGTKKILFYKDETSTPWEINITIFSNQYKAKVEGFDSGWIGKSIFSGSATFTVQLYMAINGDYPWFWWRAGFDDILVRGEIFEPKKTLIVGKHDYMIIGDEFITFKAINIRCISFPPFSFIPYSSGEQLKISKQYFGILNPKIIFAICEMY